MIIDTDQLLVPNDPVVLKQIKDCMIEVSDSMVRMQAEKDFIKEAIAALSEETEVPKKYLNKTARLYYKQNRDAVESEQESTVELYDKIFQTEQ